MPIEKPGRISEHIDMLAAAEIPIYLLRGKDWALVDSGVSPVIPTFFDQVKQYPEMEARLKYIILTHSHFDHTGGLTYILCRFPQIKVIASSHAAEVFSKPKAVQYILDINNNLAKFAGIDFQKLGLREKPLRVDRIVKEGDRIELGAGVDLEVYDAPGHSRCSLAYVLNPERALFSGEAIGYRNRPDQILPEALSSFNAFLATLEKISRIKVNIICMPHGGVLVGDELNAYFEIALEWANKFRSELKDRITRGQSDQQILDEMTVGYYQGKIKVQPEQVFRGNLQAMLSAVKKESQTST